MHRLITVYAALTDGRGKVKVVLQLVDADGENEPIFRGELDVDFVDPRMVAEIDFVMGGVTFPAAGEYRFQLFAGEDFLMERRLVVNQIPGGES